MCDGFNELLFYCSIIIRAWIYDLNINRPIFDLPIFTICSTAHPPKTNKLVQIGQHRLSDMLITLHSVGIPNPTALSAVTL